MPIYPIYLFRMGIKNDFPCFIPWLSTKVPLFNAWRQFKAIGYSYIKTSQWTQISFIGILKTQSIDMWRKKCHRMCTLTQVIPECFFLNNSVLSYILYDNAMICHRTLYPLSSLITCLQDHHVHNKSLHCFSLDVAHVMIVTIQSSVQVVRK